jgi:hypothetical protein
VSARGELAGASSLRKYEDLVRSWRRRHRVLFLTVGVICWGALLTSFLAARRWPEVGWAAGAVGGAAVTFWLLARLSPPGWIDNWESGEVGEQMTGRVLAALEREGWIVLHDLHAGKGNVDHIVVGVGGVYLLDSKRLGGSVIVDERGITVRRLEDPDLTSGHPGSSRLRSLARQTHDRVLASSRIQTWVTPVMVIWADFPQRVIEDRCIYVHGDALVAWLRSRPGKIAPSRVRQVAEAVEKSWTLESRPA